MEKSQSIKELAKALTLFKTKVGSIKKDSTNPHFKNRYASLSTILDNIRVPLLECNLEFIQIPDADMLITILTHMESGEFVQSNYQLNPVSNNPQGIGSAITYARRYALGAILGLNIEEDDDANSASGVKPASKTKSQTEAEVDKAITQLLKCNNVDELTMLKDSLDSAVLSDKRFVNAGLRRYKEIKEKSAA